MVSDRIMREVLNELSTEPRPIRVICHNLDRAESNVRKVLNVMMDLGLVEKVPIYMEGMKGMKGFTVGWRKSVSLLKKR